MSASHVLFPSSMTPALLLWILAVSVSSGVCYDPDVDLTTPQIIRRHGYSVESHTILTDDGYLLTLHRITGSPNRRSHTPTSRRPIASYPTAVSADKTITASYLTPLGNSVTTSYSQINLLPQPSTSATPTQTTSTTTSSITTSTPQSTTPQTTSTTSTPQLTTSTTTSTRQSTSTTSTPQTTTISTSPTTQTTRSTPTPQTTSTTSTTQTTSTTSTPQTTSTTSTPQTTSATSTPQTNSTTSTPQTTTISTSPTTQTTRSTPTPQTTSTTPTPQTNSTTSTPQTTTISTSPTTQTTRSTPQSTTPQTTISTTPLPPTTAPPSPSSPLPIFLQHGLLGSSADWIMAGPGKALAYLLADEGYDVWLGNARGNLYSRGHEKLSTRDPKFWDFSWHEMGYYDLPAAIDHMINVTGSSSVVYIGHSMGTTMFYVMAASRPEYNAKIRAMFSLAPVVYMRDIKSPIRLLARYVHDIEFISRILGQNEFLPHGKFLDLLAKYGCLLVATEKKICENLIFLLTGFDAVEFDKALLPLILMHTPAGTSTKAVLHYAQEIQSGKFQQYDYGTRNNWKLYNQSSPPEYNLSLITTPIELHYAKNDWLANTKDVQEFYLKLKSRIGEYLVTLPEFNHVDFLWGKDVKTLVYDILIARVKQFSPPPAKIPIGEEDRDWVKVTSKWYTDIKGKYSHKEVPQEVEKKFAGTQKTIFVNEKRQEENMV